MHWTDDDGTDAGRRRRPRRLRRRARRVLAELTGADPGPRPSGSQLKVNMVLARLPRLRSGADPATAFAGTFHVDEAAAQLDAAYAQAAAGRLPDVIPFEVYCHSLTDPSILGPVERATGHHTLTLFGLHTPAELYRDDPVGTAPGGGPPRRRPARRPPRGAAAGLPGPRRRTASPACRRPPRWTSRRPWPCRAGTSSTATCPGRWPSTPDQVGHLGRRDRAPADRRRLLRAARCAAAPSAASAATRPPATCWTRAEPVGAGRDVPPAGRPARAARSAAAGGRDLALIAAGLTFYAGIAVVPLLVLAFALTARLTSPGPGGGARRRAWPSCCRRSSAPRTPSRRLVEAGVGLTAARAGCWPCCRCRSTARGCDGRCCASADGARG